MKYAQDVRRLVATCMCQVLRFDKDYVTQRQRTIRAYSSCESLVIRDICAIYVIHSVSSRAQMNVLTGWDIRSVCVLCIVYTQFLL